MPAALIGHRFYSLYGLICCLAGSMASGKTGGSDNDEQARLRPTRDSRKAIVQKSPQLARQSAFASR